MSMLLRKKRLTGGKYNIQIVELTDHVSKQNHEGLLIKFRVQGESQVYITRISKKAFFLIDKLVDVLCETEEEISYEDAIGKMCVFTIEINGDFINLINIEAFQSVEQDDSITDEEDIINESKSIIEDNDIDDIYEESHCSFFDEYDFPDFEDEDFSDFEDDEELV